MTRDEARAVVAKGAALLDEQRPGWAQQINLGLFDITDGCACILGQLEGEFCAAAVRLLGLSDVGQAAVAHGFDVASMCGHDFPPLQDAWVEAIADRLVELAQDAARVPEHLAVAD